MNKKVSKKKSTAIITEKDNNNLPKKKNSIAETKEHTEMILVDNFSNEVL